ncbi:alpha-amylase family protein [Proteiniphilum sp. UBA5480]|jgi:hypothetical protein|uniref:alpha-amylase family protein n=1 Tax=Proteiniphilum sp. UBA5480 TaxID=1947282 RepID=UPI00257FED8D|nr:alpha-amylase family protein [Proteiniphilum sp. UBA5480]
MKKTLLLILISVLYSGVIIWGQVPERLRRDQSFFGVHFDFHAGSDCHEVGKNTTPEMVQTIINKIQPDYIQTDCKGHAGYSSYPTNVGNPAPGFFGDPLHIWRDVTARNGVALYMHYSGVWDTRAIEIHPEWAAIHADGTRDKDKTSVFGTYVDQLLVPQLKELAGHYEVDGVWVDGECWATILDYGDRSKRMFHESTGISDIPESADEPHWYEWMQFQREGFRKYMRHYVASVRSEYPNFQICSNWAFTHHMPEPVSVALDFLSGDYSPNNSVNSARFAGRYLAFQGVPWDLMAWSFSTHPSPHEQKNAMQLKREAAIVLALGGGFQAYYTQNRDGSVRLEELQVMEEVAKFARARQPWCHHSVQIPQVALLLSTSDYHRNATSLFPQYKGQSQGVLQCLLESQYSVDLVSEETLAPDMSRFPIIVIPEWENISPLFCTDLVAYAKGGGSLLVIGQETSAYFASLIGTQLQDNQFASIALGKGQIGFLPVSIGEAYEQTGNEELREQLHSAVEMMFPDPLVEISGSLWVDLSIGQLKGKRLVHLVNTSGDHKNAGIIPSIKPVGPLKISIRCAYKPKKITLQPEGKTCDFIYADGKAQVEVDKVAIYDILVIE